MNQTPLSIQMTLHTTSFSTDITPNFQNLQIKYSLTQLYGTCTLIFKKDTNLIVSVNNMIQIDLFYNEQKTNAKQVYKTLYYKIVGMRPYSSGSGVDREIRYFILDCIDAGMYYSFLTTYSNWYSGTTTQILEKYIKDIYKQYNDSPSNYNFKLNFDISDVSLDSFICVKRLSIKEIEYLINISRNMIGYRSLAGLEVRNIINWFESLSTQSYILIDERDKNKGFNQTFNYTNDVLKSYSNGLVGYYVFKWNSSNKTIDIYLNDRVVGSCTKEFTPELKDLPIYKENFMINVLFTYGFAMDFSYYQLFDIGQVLLYNNHQRDSILNGKYFIHEVNIVHKDNHQLDFFYKSVKFSDELV